MKPSLIFRQITEALAPINIAPINELALHAQMDTCLSKAGIMFEREVQTTSGPVDFVINGVVAVEVKIRGAALPITRQITRYLEDPRFSEAILVTTRHLILPLKEVKIGNEIKPISVLQLWKQFI